MWNPFKSRFRPEPNPLAKEPPYWETWTAEEETAYQKKRLLAEHIMGWDCSQKPYALLPGGEWHELGSDPFNGWYPDGKSVLNALLAKKYEVSLEINPDMAYAKASRAPWERTYKAIGKTFDQAVCRLAVTITEATANETV